VREALKRLIDGHRSDLQNLDMAELDRMEAQCEIWRLRIIKERGRRRALAREDCHFAEFHSSPSAPVSCAADSYRRRRQR
jgi:hypothetical protein